MRTTLFVISSLIVAGCGGMPPSPTAESTSKQRVVPVRAVLAAQTDVRLTSTQPASLHPYFQAEIQALATGYVTEVLADIGQRVQKGDPLAKIDVPELEKRRNILEARIRSSKASELSAQAVVALAESRVAKAKAEREQSVSSLASFDAQLTASQTELTRVGDLVSRGSLQSQKQDESQARRDGDKAAKQAAESSVLSADASIQVAIAEVASAEAMLVAAEAETQVTESQLEELDVMIGFAALKAPFDGVVTARTVDVGDLVKASDGARGATHSLFTVSQIDTLRLRIPVPESDATHVNIGDSIRVTFPSFAEEQMTVEVSRLAQSLDDATRTMLVEADVENKQGRLLPGMFGQATITLGTRVAACTLPARAIRFDEEGNAFVYLIEPDKTISRVAVTTGNDDGQTIEVLSGIEGGEQLVDAHIQRFSDGDQVSVVQ